ncbi:MAG: NRDE family protein [Cyclobacteriaceae bacterium]|jgi:uncharacterized protein with NRDE domain|nr:NRDE family protein [Cyclobacteriaceae bacterium]
MCLILFSWETHPKYKLILAANRDEFYDRPTAVASQWKDQPEVVAGRDLQAGGTWIGANNSGERIAGITNYRDPQSIDPNAHSRGELTTHFLISKDTPLAYLLKLKNSNIQYNGFNLLVGDSKHMFYYNNVNHEITELQPGTYGLSNGFFQENWPKIKKGKEALETLVKSNQVDDQSLFDILKDTVVADDNLLPKTGIPLDWERALSPLFIATEKYGTRCSTLIHLDYTGKGKLTEKTYPISGIQEEQIVELVVG